MNSPDEEIFPLRNVSVHNPDRAAAKPLVLLYHGSLVERNGLDLASMLSRRSVERSPEWN